MKDWIILIAVGLLAGALDALRDNVRDYGHNGVIRKWKGSYWSRTPSDRISWKFYGKFWLTDRLWEIVQDPFHLFKAFCILVLIFGLLGFTWQAVVVLISFQIAFELTYH